MGFRYPPINIILRTILIIANSLAIGWFVVFSNNIFTIGALCILLVFQIVFLIKYFNRTNKLINYFIIQLKNEKSGFNIPNPHNQKNTKRLTELLNEIKQIVKKVEIEKESMLFYLQTVFKYINIGLVAVDRNGKVEMVNDAFLKVFAIKKFNHLNELKTHNKHLYNHLQSNTNEDSKIIDIHTIKGVLNALVKITELRLVNKSIKLISIQNVSKELTAAEIESWRKLIRIMNHEISNSISPIVSLSKSLSGIYSNLTIEKVEKIEAIAPEIIDDTQSGLFTIMKRSERLENFINSYKSYDNLPVPQEKNLLLNDIIFHVHQVFLNIFQQKNIQFISHMTPNDITLYADEGLFEQALINIVKNACEAIDESITNPYVKINAFKNSKGTIVEIINNGIPIANEIKNNIFIPFYTTKAKGSGVGLSVVQQIMLLHKGHIKVYSAEEQTIIKLVFRNIVG